MSVTWVRRNAEAVALVDAADGSETVQLPNMATTEQVTVNRIDSSGNTVTVTVKAGRTLDGVTNGSTTVSADSSKRFLSLDAGWESLTAAGGGGGGGVTGAGGGTLTTTAQIASDTALSGTYAPLAADWATGKTFIVGQLVVNAGTLYRCTTAHTAGGSFAAGNFTALGGGGATVTIDADGTLVVNGTTVEVGTDAEIAAAIAAASAAAVSKSAVTTKGDLIVATGPATVTRKAAGANGQLLTADSAQSDGLAWVDGVALAQSGQTPSQAPAALGTAGAIGSLAAAARADHVHQDPIIHGYVSGYLYGPNGTQSTGTPTADGELSMFPMFVPAAVAIQSLHINVTGAGSANALTRLGVWLPQADGRPGALLLDAGTVATDSTGVKAAVVSATLPAGWLWFGAAPQGAASTRATLTTLAANTQIALIAGAPTWMNPGSVGFYTTATGPFGNLTNLTPAGANIAYIRFKAA